MFNVAAQVGSMQECMAVRLNLKEDRVLQGQIKVLDSQILECTRAQKSKMKLTLLHYDRLQKRISKIRSMLKTTELAEMRQLDKEGKLNERPAGVSFNSASIIDMAYRQINRRAGDIPRWLRDTRRSRHATGDMETPKHYANPEDRIRAKSALSCISPLRDKSLKSERDRHLETNDWESKLENCQTGGVFRSVTSLGFQGRQPVPTTFSKHLSKRAQTATAKIAPKADHEPEVSPRSRPQTSLPNGGYLSIQQGEAPEGNYTPYMGFATSFKTNMWRQQSLNPQVNEILQIKQQIILA